MQNETSYLMRVSSDILSTLEISEEVGWEGLIDLNVHRIIYISSVLYSFKYSDKRNPFVEDYNFSVSLRGPYSDEISKTVTFLRGRDLIQRDGNELRINHHFYKKINRELSKVRDYEEKREWIETIIYIIGIYGEEKIYDFVFRDPEYQNNIQIKSLNSLNLDTKNKSYLNIMEMKKTFEKVLGSEAKSLTDKKYLELYFEYIFSRIIKGEQN